MLNLIDKGTQQIISTVAVGSWVTLPNGDLVSPAMDGWENDDFVMVAVPAPEPPTPEQILEAERANMKLSFAQLMIGLVAEGWLAQADAEGWLAGTLPPQVLATINLLPDENQFPAKARAIRPSEILRTDPLVSMMALAQGRSPNEIDAFFKTYAAA